MHSTQTSSGITFHHKGNYIGDVVINLTKKSGLVVEEEGSYRITLPFESCLREFVIGYLRQKTVENFDNMTDEEFVNWSTATDIHNGNE